MDTLRRAAEAQYESRLAYFLQEQFPDAAQESQAVLSNGVRTLIANARHYGLETERQIALYVVSGWLLGSDFDEQFPAVREVLNSAATPGYKSEWLAQFTVKFFKTLEERS